jgi:hypothetical protein
MHRMEREGRGAGLAKVDRGGSMRHRTPPTYKPGMTEEEWQDAIADYLDACEGDREEQDD